MRVAKKRKRLTPEHRIQNGIVAMLRLHRCTVFQGNVGKVRTPDGSKTIRHSSLIVWRAETFDLNQGRSTPFSFL